MVKIDYLKYFIAFMNIRTKHIHKRIDTLKRVTNNRVNDNSIDM